MMLIWPWFVESWQHLDFIFLTGTISPIHYNECSITARPKAARLPLSHYMRGQMNDSCGTGTYYVTWLLCLSSGGSLCLSWSATCLSASARSTQRPLSLLSSQEEVSEELVCHYPCYANFLFVRFFHWFLSIVISMYSCPVSMLLVKNAAKSQWKWKSDNSFLQEFDSMSEDLMMKEMLLTT